MRMNGDRVVREIEGRFSEEELRGQKHCDELQVSSVRTQPNLGCRRLRHQVVTLGFLSKDLPADLISAQLAASLAAESDEMTVLVRFTRQDDIGDTVEAAEADLSLNGEFHMPPQIRRTSAGFHSLILGVGGEPPSPAGIASLVNQLRCHFTHVLLAAVVNERSSPWFSECLLRSDMCYLFLQPNADGVADYEQLIREAKRSSGGNRVAQTKLIGCLAEEESADGFDRFVPCTGKPTHMFIHCCPTPERARKEPQSGLASLFCTDVRRLAREICGRLVGLALSSGAAKGFAHVGVIQVLEENGIEVVKDAAGE